MEKESRRNFVKKTAIISTGSLATSLPVEAFANVSENKKLKISVVGCGGRGSGAIVQALEADDNVEIVSMADVFADRIERSINGIKEHFGDKKKINIKQKNIFFPYMTQLKLTEQMQK